MTTEEIAEMTPVEIDTAIAALMQKQDSFRAKAAGHWDTVTSLVHSILRITSNSRVPRPTKEQVREFLMEYSMISVSEEDQREAYPNIAARTHAARAWSHYNKAVDAQSAVDDLWEEIRPYDEEFKARGGWTRAFLVNNVNGHVHRSMYCSTCFNTTKYHWVTEYSDHDESEIVEAAGERACTVCYPSAPVEVLNRPTKIFTPEEKEAQRQREERAAKKAEREAAKITITVWDADWRTNGDVAKDVTWKTLRALQNDTGALVRKLHGSWAMVHGFNVPNDTDKALMNLNRMLSMLAQHGVDTEALVTKNVKRAEKEG